MDTGTLYIVSSPIGNMEDISLRAIDTLKKVDVIISEDTRETHKLIERHDIGEKKQYSYRDQVHKKMFPKIKEMLDSGLKLALITDNGTPLISDPGYKLVRDLIVMGYKIDTIPGPSAVIAALTISGLPTDNFIFIGFLPRSNKRKNMLRKYAKLQATLTIYESPYRIQRLISEVLDILGDRTICVVKDVTKKFQDIKRGKASELINEYENVTKGEYVLLVAKEGFELNT